jgi:Zn-dependent peptidase ImmA (M78 family)
MTVRRKLIRSQAEALLRRFTVTSAPVPVTTIARGLGAEVQFVPADDTLSGFLYRERGANRTVIGVNANHHENRQNFTVGHELGHLVLHDMEDIHVDRGFSVRLRNATSSEGTHVEEKEANLFAAEILMPAKFLKKDVQTIDAVDLDDETVIAALATKYGVSTQAMTFRLGYLGYIQL